MNRITRNERWVSAAYATVKLEQNMCITIQSLGRLDVQLVIGDELFLADFENNRNSMDENQKLNDRFTLSYLWVLGGYEIVRTICQRIKEKGNTVPNEVAVKFNELKKEFGRLRMPLAKMEPASAHRETDSRFAWPAISDKGIAWEVSRDVFITRRDLADGLLDALECAQSNLNKPA